jgi:hypothetical protein
MISKSSEGGGSLPIVDYIGFMQIDLGAVNFDALPDISFEVRVPLCLPPCSSQGQALAKARSATSAVDPDREGYHQQPWLSSLSAVPQARCARNPRRCQVLLTDRPECLARACAPARCWTVSVCHHAPDDAPQWSINYRRYVRQRTYRATP